jgi:diacylglycerol kinase family enzyme
VGERPFTDLGVVVNARAGRVRREPALLSRLTRLVRPERLAVTGSPAEVRGVLEDFRAARVDALAVLGGDGTVTGTLTPVIEVWGEAPLPAVCLLAGGTINTIPHAAGPGGRPDGALARLLRGGPVRVSTLNVLAVRSADGRSRYGMIFGLGVVARFLDLYYAHRARGPAAAALGVARSLGSVLVGGGLARRLFRPFEVKLEADGEAVERGPLTGLAAGAVRDIGLGFKPFFHAGARPGCFHWITTDSSGPGIALELPAAAGGATVPGGALRHATSARLRVQLAEPLPFTVDGDLFPPGPTLEIAAGPELRFLAP